MGVGVFFFLRARAKNAAAPLRGERNTAPRARAGPGKRHPARGTPRAQPRDVRRAGHDTWNLTGEALGRPRKRSWRRCSHARSGRRSAIRGAHSGALDRPEPSDHAARAPILTSAPYSAADASGSSFAAGARRLPKGSMRAAGAAGGFGTCSTRSGRSRRSGRTVGTPARPRQVASAGAGAALSLPTARCRRARAGHAFVAAHPVLAHAGTGAQGADATLLPGVSSRRSRSVRPDRRPLTCLTHP